MSAAVVLGELAAPTGIGRRQAVDPRVGMVVALPCRERWFPWVVLQQPVAVASVPFVRVHLARTGGGWPRVARLFGVDDEVLLVSRHHGVCLRCGGLSPCSDELVERALHGMSALEDWLDLSRVAVESDGQPS